MLSQLLVTMLGRAPQPAELADWIAAMPAGNKAAVAQAMFDTLGTQGFYPATMSDSEFIKQLYLVTLGRLPGEEGTTFYLKMMQDKTVTRGDVIVSFIDGIRSQPDLARFEDKVGAGLYPNGTRPAADFTIAGVEKQLALREHAADRAISTVYDALGHATHVVESASFVYDVLGTGTGTAAALGGAEMSKVTRSDYNRFGEVIRQRVYGGDRTTQRTVGSDTRYYYDLRGNKSAMFATANTAASLAASRAGVSGVAGDVGGYLTEMQYDDAGRVVGIREYATLLDEKNGWRDDGYDAVGTNANDRVSGIKFDDNGQKIAEERIGVIVDSAVPVLTDSARLREDVVTTFKYDAVGNQILSTDALGGEVRSFYDTVGRVTAVTRKATPNGSIVMVGFQRDVYGNVVVRTDYANGASGDTGLPPPPATGADRDRTTVTKYNRNGMAIETRDAEDKLAYTSYDLAGRVAKEWRGVTTMADLAKTGERRVMTSFKITSYDKLGRVIDVVTPGTMTTSPEYPAKAEVLGSMTPTESARVEWAGENKVKLSFADLGKVAIYVDLEYRTRQGILRDEFEPELHVTRDGITDPAVVRRTGFSIADASAANVLTWTDPPGQNPSGIGDILSAKVYLVDGAGNKVFKYELNQTQLVTHPAVVDVADEAMVANHQQNTYNGFGELTARSHNGTMFEYADYDASGQVWRTNAGDGVDKVIHHNIAGQVTAQIMSAATAPNGATRLANFSSAQSLQTLLDGYYPVDAIGDFVRAETRYDMMGHVIGQVGSAQTVPGAATATVLEGVKYLDYTVKAVAEFADWPDDGTGSHGTTVLYHNELQVSVSLPAGSPAADYMIVVDYLEVTRAAETKAEALQPHTYTQIVTAESMADGVADLKWTGHVLGPVENIRIFTRSLNGEWILVSGQERGTTQQFLRVATPPTAMASTRLLYKMEAPVAAETETVLAQTASLGDFFLFDTKGIAPGTYSFRALYSDAIDSAVQHPYESGTFTVDANGRVSVSSTGKAATVVRPTSYQRVDRWGNVVSVTDPRDTRWSMQYIYNANNQVLDKHTITEVGGTLKVVGTVSSYYDQLGRDVGSRDARRALTRMVYDTNGFLGEVIHADNGGVHNKFNLFGERVSMAQTEGATTAYAYDRMGRLTSTSTAEVEVGVAFHHADGGGMNLAVTTRKLVDTYYYDELGRKVTSVNGAGERSTAGYDLEGNVVWTRQGYLADANGNPVTGAAGRIMRMAYDAFHHKTAEYNGNFDSMTWKVDAFGKVLSHVDLGKATISYAYDGMNRLVRQTSTERFTTVGTPTSLGSQDIRYTYEGGLLTKISDEATKTTTTYAYNLVGQHVRENTVAIVENVAVTAQNNFIEYDQQGRMTHVADGQSDVEITYDKNGNRTRVVTKSIDGYGNSHRVDANNKFDVMNRMTVANGKFNESDPNNPLMGPNGHVMTYNLAGWRLTDSYMYSGPDRYDPKLTMETFSYDEAGRLSEVERDHVMTDIRTYDGAGRIVRSGQMNGVDEKALRQFGLVAETRTYAYDSSGQVIRMKSRQVDGVFKDDLYYMPRSGGAGGYDGAGNLVGYSVVPPKFANHTDYSSRFELFETYKEALVTGYVNGTSRDVVSYFDQNGNVKKIIDNSDPDKPLTRTFINDALGRVLYKTDASGITRTMIVNGEVMGTTGRNVGTDGFANPYESATSGANIAAPTIFTVRVDGESLQAIARTVWGDANLWYLIADANGLSGGEKLSANQLLKLPARVNTVHNAYDTFAPYSASEAIGTTMPTMPAAAGAPPKCGPVGAIVTVIVAVVMMYVMPAGASIWAKMAIAAISAGVASAAGQVAGMLAGEQEKFSWKAVGMAAVGGAVGAGMAFQPFGAAQPLANGMFNSALANATIQAIAVKANVQEHFEWRNVAVAGMGPVIGQVFGGINLGSSPIGVLASRTLSSFLGGVTTAALRGGRVEYGQIALDSFGNALGQRSREVMLPQAEERPTIGLSDSQMRSPIPGIPPALQDLPFLNVHGVDDAENFSFNNGISSPSAAPQADVGGGSGGGTRKSLDYGSLTLNNETQAATDTTGYVEGMRTESGMVFGTNGKRPSWVNRNIVYPLQKWLSNDGKSTSDGQHASGHFDNSSIGRPSRISAQLNLEDTEAKMGRLERHGFNLNINQQMEYARLNNIRNSQANIVLNMGNVESQNGGAGIRKDYSGHARVIRYISDRDFAGLPDFFTTHGSGLRDGPTHTAELWAHGTPDGQTVASMSAGELSKHIDATTKIGPNIKNFVWWVCNAGHGTNPIAMQYSASHPGVTIKAPDGKLFAYGPIQENVPYHKEVKSVFGYTPDFDTAGNWRYFKDGKEIKGP
ncbi:hypothetical protein CR152_24590 [Massilia violaceinigra]|uniref:DUF4214 domain-containing protein n=2 Tax=Massilia violaceinigra TaxID=2045208 RepID=A0A2D2DVS3_9BURK|nr:hypothetical protein CR152_24590 [Massilia violaceinigra]